MNRRTQWLIGLGVLGSALGLATCAALYSAATAPNAYQASKIKNPNWKTMTVERAQDNRSVLDAEWAIVRRESKGEYDEVDVEIRFISHAASEWTQAYYSWVMDAAGHRYMSTIDGAYLPLSFAPEIRQTINRLFHVSPTSEGLDLHLSGALVLK